MPIYEYQCTNCGEIVEAFQKISDQPLTLCSACKNHSLIKLVSRSGFRLKGEGWYETDFKGGDSKKNLAKADTDTTENSGTDTGSRAKETQSISKTDAQTADKASDKSSTSTTSTSSTATKVEE